MQLLNFATSTAKKAGKLIKKMSAIRGEVTFKGKNDIVTAADFAAEELIIKEIQKHFPAHAILSEETNPELTEMSEYLWIIDPLDGTMNFSHGLKQYAVSIGLFKAKKQDKSKNFAYLEGELILGVVYSPELDELFYAEKGKGAFLNNKPIKVSSATKIENSLMVTGFHTTNKNENLPYFKKMLGKCQGMRRLGSAALDLCYVAAGNFEGYWEFNLKPWDIAAGSLIVKEAGGNVTDTNGNLLDLFGQDILASNGRVHKEIIELFS